MLSNSQARIYSFRRLLGALSLLWYHGVKYLLPTIPDPPHEYKYGCLRKWMDFYFEFCRCVFQNNLSLIHFQSMKQFIEETIFKACNLFKHYGRREKIYRSVVCYDKCTNIELCVFSEQFFLLMPILFNRLLNLMALFSWSKLRIIRQDLQP